MTGPLLHCHHLQGDLVLLLEPLGETKSVAGQLLSVQGELLVVMTWLEGLRVILRYQRLDESQILHSRVFPIPELHQRVVIMPWLGLPKAMLRIHLVQVASAPVHRKADAFLPGLLGHGPAIVIDFGFQLPGIIHEFHPIAMQPLEVRDEIVIDATVQHRLLLAYQGCHGLSSGRDVGGHVAL